MPWAAWVNIVASVAAFVLYEMYIRWIGAAAPMKIAHSAHAAIRASWVKSVMERPGMEILVVQTLRNSVMAASFMASTSILALSGTVTLSSVGNPDSKLWQSLSAGSAEHLLFALKLLLLAASFFVSFLFMAMSVRFFNHTAYLITTTVDPAELADKQALAIGYLNRAGNYYSMGLRAFFACVPFLAGLFSTYLMLPATLILLFILYWFDRIPGNAF